MGKSMRSLISKKLFLGIGLLLLIQTAILAQGNCEALTKDSDEQKACEYGHRAIEFKQGSRESLVLFDSAIALNPNYAWAYYEKSITFLKRGYLTKGMSLLNKAVELEPLSYLCYRAYWFFQHKSYAQAMIDLERYYAMEGAYQQNTPGGALDMRIVLAVAHAQQGAYDRALVIVNNVINAYESDDFAGPYDFHTLGVLYLKNRQYAQAKEALLRSIVRNEQFADTYYYLALIAQEEGDIQAAKSYIEEAILRYEGEKDGYTGYPFCFPVSKEQALSLKVALERK